MSCSQHGIRFRYRVINPQAWIKAQELICSPSRHAATLLLHLFVQTSTSLGAEKNRSLACRQNRRNAPPGWAEQRETHAHAVSDRKQGTHREHLGFFFCQAEQSRCLRTVRPARRRPCNEHGLRFAGVNYSKHVLRGVRLLPVLPKMLRRG